MFDASGGTYEHYPVSTGWSETSATWNSIPPLGHQGQPMGTPHPGSTTNYTVELNSSRVVQRWVNGASVNSGIMILDGGTRDGRDIRSSESVTASQRPKLTVTYQN